MWREKNRFLIKRSFAVLFLKIHKFKKCGNWCKETSQRCKVVFLIARQAIIPFFATNSILNYLIKEISLLSCGEL